MIRRAVLPAVLVACMLVAPAVSRATPLDIPSVAPKQFRALLRAKLHTSERRASAMTQIELPRQHGYRLMVFGEGNLVAFVVMRRDGSVRSSLRSKAAFSQVATGYVTRGTVTPTRIEGSFGRFGSVNLRFVPSGRTVKGGRRRCFRHARYTTRHGRFVGNVRFTGEHGYVAVRAHRAKGRVRTPRHLQCRYRGFRVGAVRRRSARRSEDPTVSGLVAEYRQPTNSTELLAFQVHFPLRERNLALLLAVQEEVKERMAVVRYAMMFSGRSVLSRDDALTSATLHPPRPFHGKGIYSAAPDGTTTWGGSLSISFPGAPRQPLVGPEFTSKLEAGF